MSVAPLCATARSNLFISHSLYVQAGCALVARLLAAARVFEIAVKAGYVSCQLARDRDDFATDPGPVSDRYTVFNGREKVPKRPLGLPLRLLVLDMVNQSSC